MNPSETAELMENIVKIRDTFQIAIMLIEHDMNLVMGICEGICVLNFGQIIAKGTAGGDPDQPGGHRGLSGHRRRRREADGAMLKVEDINVYYGAIHAIKGVSFEVNEGEIVTLIGANGAGKSTILKTVSGLLALQDRLHRPSWARASAACPPTRSSPRAWPRCPRAGGSSSR